MAIEKEMTIKEIVDIIRANDEWKQWLERHDDSSPRFIDEAKNGSKVWNEKTLTEFFNKGEEHYVATLKMGNFSKKEQNEIINNWGCISGYLKELAENQTTPNWKCYENLKNEIEKHARKNAPATNRLIASLQPQLLCTIVSKGKPPRRDGSCKDRGIKTLFRLLKDRTNYSNNIVIPEYEEEDWFKNSHNLIKLFEGQLPDKEYADGFAKYPWEVLEYLLEHNVRVKIIEKSEIR